MHGHSVISEVNVDHFLEGATQVTKVFDVSSSGFVKNSRFTTQTTLDHLHLGVEVLCDLLDVTLLLITKQMQVVRASHSVHERRQTWSLRNFEANSEL